MARESSNVSRLLSAFRPVEEAQRRLAFLRTETCIKSGVA